MADGDDTHTELPGPADVVALDVPKKKLSRKERRAQAKLEAEADAVIRKQLFERHPEMVKEARDAGVDEDTIYSWIIKLAPIKATDEELALIAAKGTDTLAPPSPKRSQLMIWRHHIAHWWHHGKGLQRLIYGSAWVSILWAAVKVTAWWGYIAGLIIVGMKLRVVVGEIDPKHLPLFWRTLNERQLMLKNSIITLQQWTTSPPSDDARREFQISVLRLIASFIRDHRADLGGKKVFVNLLVRSGDDAVVIARADDNRAVPMRYTKKQCSIAWKALETGVPQMTGDLYADAPETTPGKSYKSVLALPVKLRDRVLAVVSIDSEMKHHFYSHFDKLQTLLGPYVQLIASAIDEDHDNNRPLSEA